MKPHIKRIYGVWHCGIKGIPNRYLGIGFTLSSMKAARDGIADALGINDSRFVSHPYIKDEVRKGGVVEIRITPEPKP